MCASERSRRCSLLGEIVDVEPRRPPIAQCVGPPCLFGRISFVPRLIPAGGYDERNVRLIVDLTGGTS